MPLRYGKSDADFEYNAHELMKAGHSKAQSFAIAYSIKRGDTKKPKHEKINETAEKKTLYISRQLLNADQFLFWARSQGFKSTLEPKDLHVTVAYSRTPVNWNDVPDSFDFENVPSDFFGRKVEKLGENAIVLKFKSSDLQRRWKELRECGCSWDYSEYIPHVTISYWDKSGYLPDSNEIDLNAIEPYTGPLKFGYERYEEIDEEWSSKIKHVSVEDCMKKKHDEECDEDSGGEMETDPKDDFITYADFINRRL